MFKYLKLLFSKSNAVDTLTTLPKFLRDGTTLAEAKHLIAPVEQQVTKEPMVNILIPRKPNSKLGAFRRVTYDPGTISKPRIL